MSEKILNNKHKDEILRILGLVNTDGIFRMGKLFNTDLNNYFYDTGTGKVIQLDDETFYIMSLWFSQEKQEKYSVDSFINDKYINIDSLSELLELCIKENLFRAIKPKTLYTPHHTEKLQYMIDSQCEQLILELTGKCNLRCNYCIYNETYTDNREFNQEDMSIDIAKKAVDYFFEHSSDKMAVTFYGGEPLVKFDLLKWVIEYSLEKNKEFEKEMTFSLTTNLTLMTEVIAEYLTKVPGLSILCSLDGPKEVHNSNRKSVNGNGCFDEAFSGFQILCEACKRNNNVIGISVNAVFAPPYTYDKLFTIDKFFSELDFIPKNMRINITYPTSGSVDNKEWISKMKNNPKYHINTYDLIDTLWKWSKIKNTGNIEKKSNYNLSIGLEQALTKINDRYISDEPKEVYGMNGCCVPGSRRLYVNTKGEYTPCERIGICPIIGDAFTGIDIDKVKKYYVEDYVEKSIKKCSNCWAVRLCGICYVGRYDKEGFNESKGNCDGVRREIARNLSYYHELLETNKSKLDFLKDITIS